MDLVSARDAEAWLAARCRQLAADPDGIAQDVREANALRLAAMLLGPGLQAEAQCLLRACERYFAEHAEERLPAAEVLRRGWVASLPRLRETLRRSLRP